MISGRQAVFRDIGVQAAGNYLATAVRVLRGFVIAGMLGPASMGVVAVGNLLMNYAQYTDLGITQAVGRETPMALGSGKEADARAWGWYAIVSQLVSGLVVIAASVVWALSPLGAAQPIEVRMVVVIAAIATVATGEMLALQIGLKSWGDFAGASMALVLLAVLNLAFGIVGAWLAGAVGVTIGVVLATAIASGWAWLRFRARGFVGIRAEKLRALLRIGFPLALLTFIGFNLENVDQLMILALLDRTQLGLYVIVIQAGGLITLTGLSISNVVGPRLLKRYAAEQTLESIHDYTWKPTGALAALMPVVICLAWLFGSLIIVWLLPSYAPSIGPFKIYLAAMYFLTLNLGVSTTLLALKKHALNVPIMLGCIALNVALDLVLVGAMGLGLIGIATASLVTYGVYWVLHTGLVRWQFERDVMATIRRNAPLAWPGLMLVVFLIVSHLTGTLYRPAPYADAAFVLVAVAAGFARVRELAPELTQMLGDRSGR